MTGLFTTIGSKQNPSKKPRIILFAVIFLVILGLLFFYLNRSSKTPLDRVREVLLVDESENPTILQIDDPEKLKAQNTGLYDGVEKGDILMIFRNYFVIYRESSGKIINFVKIQQ